MICLWFRVLFTLNLVTTLKSRIIEPCAMSSDFPLSVRSGNFCFFSVSAGGSCVFAVFFAPIPEKGISDLIAHGSIIWDFTVSVWCSCTSKPRNGVFTKTTKLYSLTVLSIEQRTRNFIVPIYHATLSNPLDSAFLTPIRSLEQFVTSPVLITAPPVSANWNCPTFLGRRANRKDRKSVV